MPTFFSPDGNPEIWRDCPSGYMTPEAWATAHSTPEEIHTLDELKTAKKAELAGDRFTFETSGVAVSGVTIATDRESQALITGAALAAMRDNEYSLTWKGLNGFVDLTAAQVIAIAMAVRTHVQIAFNQESKLVAQVDAASDSATVEAIAWVDPE